MTLLMIVDPQDPLRHFPLRKVSFSKSNENSALERKFIVLRNGLYDNILLKKKLGLIFQGVCDGG